MSSEEQQQAEDVLPKASSLFGNSQPKSIAQIVENNKGVIISVFSGALTNVLTSFDQPYEIFLGVILSMFIWYTMSQGARNAAILLSRNKGSESWRTALVSYLDLISIVMVLFFSQYVTSIATKEWEKAGFGQWDTDFVGIFFISYAISFLVVITSHANVQKVEDYVEEQKKKKK
jgi:hypothetical protein